MPDRFEGAPNPVKAPAGLIAALDALNKAAGLVTANYVAAMAIGEVLMGPSPKDERAKAGPPPSGAFPFMLKVLNEIIDVSTETAEIQRGILRELGRAQQASEIS